MDDFELFEELGKGNYGTVQKVWHKPTKVTMALKVSFEFRRAGGRREGGRG
jgi:serine/threonine protein kinase